VADVTCYGTSLRFHQAGSGKMTREFLDAFVELGDRAPKCRAQVDRAFAAGFLVLLFFGNGGCLLCWERHSRLGLNCG
jgi:hypothetical protein